jgi:HK97 family phage portal protein
MAHIFTKEFWLGPETYSEPIQQQGSVDSAGGTSPLSGVVPPPRPTGPILDARTALSIGPVYTAVALIKAGVSQLPVAVQRGGVDLPVPSLVAKPDVRTTQTQFLSLTAGCLATYGNAFWRLHRAVEVYGETIVSIEVLNPELVVIDWDRGQKVYRYGNTTFRDWQVSHLMVFPHFEDSSNVIKGLGPIQANRRELQAILEMNEFLSAFYRNNGIPTGILTTDSALAAGDADAIRSRWYEVAANNGIQVLPNGLTFQQISLDPEKAMYHASAQKAVVDIARIFRMPDRYLLAAVDGSSMTYSNMQDVDRQFIRYGLTEYLTAIEDAFSDLLPRGQRAKFNVDAFLRGSTKERYEAHQIALNAGFLTVNEVRALEDLEPKTGGNDLKKPAVPNPNEGVSNDNTE